MDARITVLLGASLLSWSVHAASPRIEPADPVEFERIALRQDVDSCVFNKDAVQVRIDDRTIVVTQRSNACLVPGATEVVDIQLGAYPAGEYRVVLREADSQFELAHVDVQVSTLVQPAVFPPPPRPLANYSGLWWNGVDAGWGLSLQQGTSNALFGALLVLDENGLPRWYSIQSGQWQSATRWAGRVLRSSSSGGTVTHVDIGAVTLDFTMTPGREGLGTISLLVDGVPSTRNIQRFRF